MQGISQAASHRSSSSLLGLSGIELASELVQLTRLNRLSNTRHVLLIERKL